jgi:hypothetical protein
MVEQETLIGFAGIEKEMQTKRKVACYFITFTFNKMIIKPSCAIIINLF